MPPSPSKRKDLAMKNKRKILLIDDEKSFTSLLKMNLEQTGEYQVRVENEPEDGVSAAREFRPDLILLDIIMPRLPGGNIAAMMKEDPQLAEIPVVFLTAAVTKSRVAEHEGIISDYPFVAKPVTVEEIILTIEKYALK